jgi:hypothetical protein
MIARIVLSFFLHPSLSARPYKPGRHRQRVRPERQFLCLLAGTAVRRILDANT